MVNFNDYADNLQQEVVTDMAESYFGARTNLDAMIEQFHVMVEEFAAMKSKLAEATARLHLLLLDRATSRDFYISLDIVPSCIPYNDDIVTSMDEKPPFALTKRGRYRKAVLRAYDKFQKVADEYLNGRYCQDDEAQGRKRLTVHYLRLRALCEYINNEIERVNNDLSPSGRLRFLRGMDPGECERMQQMGEACLLEGGSLDQDLKFEAINFQSLGLPLVQDLPGLSKVKTLIDHFCDDLYPKRKADIDAILSQGVEGGKR